MTAKRNFKRRVRDRQAQTGERYTAARRRLLADRSGATDPAESAERAVPVVELHDATVAAARLGFRCRISLFPALADRAEPEAVLAGLRDALVAATETPMTAQLFAIAFGVAVGPIPVREMGGFERMRREVRIRRLPWRPRLESEAAIEHGLLIFWVAGREGPVRVLCMLWDQGRSLVLALADDHAAQLLEDEAPPPPHVFGVGDLVRVTEGVFAHFFGTVEAVRARASRVRVELSLAERIVVVELDATQVERAAALLVLIYNGRRYPVTTDTLVIGRDLQGAGLAILAHDSARGYAAVLWRDGVYYLKDLGSTAGIIYKGMQIDNKRIAEGDVFSLGGHEIRFTFGRDVTAR